MTTKTTPMRTAPQPSLAVWQARALHTVTCPSGQRLRIRIPSLGTILEQGDLPEDLIDIALLELTSENGVAGAVAKEAARDDLDDEMRARVLEKFRAFGRLMKHIAAAAIAEVENDGDWVPVSLGPDELDELPEDDVAMIAEIGLRLRGDDAVGVTIGVEPLGRWATFRAAHGCPEENCAGCEEVVRVLSSVHVGAV